MRVVNFMRAHSVVEKFCGELKKATNPKNSLNKQPFPPFSENIFTGSPSPAPYESYSKEKKKETPHNKNAV